MESTYAQLGGPDDYRPVERRDDVLVYTSEKFDAARVICGPVRAHLSASSGHKNEGLAKRPAKLRVAKNAVSAIK